MFIIILAGTSCAKNEKYCTLYRGIIEIYTVSARYHGYRRRRSRCSRFIDRQTRAPCRPATARITAGDDWRTQRDFHFPHALSVVYHPLLCWVSLPRRITFEEKLDLTFRRSLEILILFNSIFIIMFIRERVCASDWIIYILWKYLHRFLFF